MNISKKYQLKDNQYFKEKFDKKQIVLHHTAGNSGAKGVVDWWNSNKSRVSTCYIIDRDGSIYQVFEDDKMWGYHLGVRGKVFKEHGVKYTGHAEFLDEYSIGIELDCWGQLTKKGSNFYTYSNRKIDSSEVCEYEEPYKGFKYYQKYSKEQIHSLKELLLNLSKKHDIPTYYNPMMWDVYKPALDVVPGIYSHTSYRSDKFDCHPQEELINMLRSIDPLVKMDYKI